MQNILVCHLVNQFDVGGMENGLVNIINFNSNRSIIHNICALRVIGDAYERLTNYTGSVYSLQAYGPTRLIFLQLRKILYDMKPKIVHIRHWGPLVDTILSVDTSRLKTNVVFSYHGKSYNDLFLKSGLRSVVRMIFLKRVGRIITLNKTMRQELITDYNVSEKKITIIENGVDTDKFCPAASSDERAFLRKKLKVPVSSFVVGAVGRLDKIKDYTTLIKAVSRLSKRIKNLVLIIIGDGPEYSKLRNAAYAMGIGENTIFPGKSNRVSDYLKTIDVFVQPSLYEGFSNGILEAMSSALPVLATKLEGNQEIIDEESTGLLFRAKDFVTLSEMLLKLYQHAELRHELGAKACEKVRSRWTLQKMAKNYENFYLNLAF